MGEEGLGAPHVRDGHDRRAHPSPPSPMSMEGTWKSGCSSVAMIRCACASNRRWLLRCPAACKLLLTIDP